MEVKESIVRDVVIVGGGTAGWLTALHIKVGFGTTARVTLIESPDVPTIGVGEGTQPTLRSHLDSLSIDEDDSVRACGSSYKNGIRFVGWCGGDGPDEYLHPFFSGPTQERNSPLSRMHLWHALHQAGRSDIGRLEDVFPESLLMRERKAPVAFHDGKRMQPPILNYALHVDAAKLGLYLRDIAVERGVRHVRDHVDGIALAANGHIDHVTTRQHGPIDGQIFVDCTGFRRLLIGELVKDFVDFGPWLLNDRAVTRRVPHQESAAIESCTVSSAMKYGWMWQVPLLERIGCGYVYSSQFVSDDDAEAEFQAALGGEPGDTQLVQFQTGYLRQQWVKNCVAIGLSGGFIEPLEATGIALITYSLQRLSECWPTTLFLPALQERFNTIMARSFEWVRDFIVMHYCLSQRDDTEYWQAVRRPEMVPDSARERLDELGRIWPFWEMGKDETCYRLPDASLACVLAGFNHLPRFCNPTVGGLSEQGVAAALQPYIQNVHALAGMCPDHRAFLESVNAAAVAG